jgi:4-amino-4-deoxy-L-arabinose transferase-like glycosyltransferase
VHLTAYDVSKHDLGYVVGMEAESGEIGAGHLGYIEYICKNRALPDFNPTFRWSFYNPPFFHVCAALCLRFWLMLEIPEAASWELVQYFPCLTIGAAVLGMYLILRDLRIRGVPLLCGVALLSFHPTLTYMSLALNNDALALCLTVWAVWFALRWFRSPRVPSLVGVALCVGLGMMTKLTVALIAPPIAFLFLYRFFKDRQWIPYLKQFGLFALICCPLGLFWSIRNKWLYDIPMTYVQSLPWDSAQNVSGFSLWERFGFPSFSDLLRVESSFSPASEIGFADHNLWSQTLRTALFDDNALALAVDGSAYRWATVLMVLAMALTLLYTVLSVIGLFRARDTHGALRAFIAMSAVLTLASFVKFCYEYPMTCTIHFRYITPCLLWGCAGLGLWWQSTTGGETARRRLPARMTMGVTLGLTLAFCALSAWLCLEGLPRVAE